MNQISFILEHTTIYWHPIILALAVMSGICFFMACCHYSRIPEIWVPSFGQRMRWKCR